MIKGNSIYFIALVFLVALCGLFSCSSNDQVAHKQKVLRHVVALKFKEEISEERRAQAIQNFLDLKDQIPEIKQFEGGADISLEGLTKGFTHCFILTFENEAARDTYLPHPEHVRVAEENKPMLSDLLVVDFWGEQIIE